MAIKTKEVVGVTSSSNVTVWAEWNALQPPNRRCYAKAYKSEGGPITFPQPLSGYSKCDLVLSATLTNSTYKGYSGSGIGLSLGGRVFQSTGSTTLQNVTPSTSIPCGTFGNANQEITSLNLPESTKIEELWLKGNAKYVYTFEIGDPTVENLTCQGKFWERDIVVNWRSQNQAGYEYELYYNNNKVKSGAGNQETTFKIPANTFAGTLPASVRVRTYNVDDEGNKYYSDWAEQIITLKDIEATISDLIITGEHWEEDITLSWQSTDQQQLKIEVWQDNILLKTYTGTTDNRYKIPKNTLEAGEYLIKVWVGYANRFVNNQSRNITLRNIVPTISNLYLSGSNIDYDLILSWESTYQDKILIEVYKGDTKVDTVNLTTEKSYTIANNSLETGAYIFKAKVAYTSATGDRWTDFKQLNVTLVESLPSIGALQPDGIVLDKNDAIKAWWTSQNQSAYELEVITAGYKYNGTTEKEHFIPMGTLQVGEHKIKLTITFITSEGVRKKVSKEVSFIVTGKPNTPTITSNSTYSYNRPIITWDSAEQLGFICIIEDMDENAIWSSDWQNGLITRVKCMQYLPNGIYRAKVKIMNEFSDESDFAIKVFEVNVSQQVTIQVQLQDISFGKRILWSNKDAYYSAFYIIRNGVVIAKTDRQEYIDYACKHGENTYRIRGVTKNDTYIDSELIYTHFRLPHSTLATIDNKGECINCGLQRNYNEFNLNYSISGKVIYLTGREHPVVISGEHVTEEYSINFSSKDYEKFLKMCSKRKTFIYRDKLGKVLYLSIIDIGLKIDYFGGVYTTKGLKVDYQEEIEYD